MLNTPAGNPAACSASVTTCVWIALISLGLTTAVQPAISFTGSTAVGKAILRSLSAVHEARTEGQWNCLRCGINL